MIRKTSVLVRVQPSGIVSGLALKFSLSVRKSISSIRFVYITTMSFSANGPTKHDSSRFEANAR